MRHVHQLYKVKLYVQEWHISNDSNTFALYFDLNRMSASLCISSKQYAFMSNLLMHLFAIIDGHSSCQRCTYPVRGVWALAWHLVCLSGAACRSRRWFFWTPSPLHSCNRPSWTPESSPQRLEIPTLIWHTSTVRFPLQPCRKRNRMALGECCLKMQHAILDALWWYT